MKLAGVLGIGLLLFTHASGQDSPADNEIQSLGERLLGQAKAQHDKKEWLEAIELAERARTAFLALSELYASQKRTADLRRLNEAVTQCNQLIRLSRDARKADADTRVPPPPNPPAPPKDPEPVARPPEKPEPPVAAAQEQAEKSIREVFRADYAKSSLAEKQALARKLLRQAVETRADRVAQYVLFREAVDLAVQASDLTTAFSAISEMAKTFTVDPLAFRVAAISKFPPGQSHDSSAKIVEGCLGVAEESVRVDHYDIGLLVLKKAEIHARNPLHVTLLAQVQSRIKEADETQKEYESVRSSERALLERPDHALSCLRVGRFQCFHKGDWERGLALLRKGADGDLRKLAEAEAGNPGMEAQLALADGWWAIAEKEVGPIAKDSIRAHARHWYAQALPGLSGFPRTRVQKILEDLAYEQNAKWAVDLLKLIDPKKDSVAGEWKREGQALVSPTVDIARLQIPFDPPDEYDLKIVVSAKGHRNAFVVGLVGGGRQFISVMDAFENGDQGGLEVVDGKASRENETAIRGKVFTDEKPRTVLCSVRKNRCTVSVDGRILIDWKADYRRVGVWEWWSVPNKRVLYLATAGTAFQYDQIWLTPVSAQGKKLR